MLQQRHEIQHALPAVGVDVDAAVVEKSLAVAQAVLAKISAGQAWVEEHDANVIRRQRQGRLAQFIGGLLPLVEPITRPARVRSAPTTRPASSRARHRAR